MKNKKLFPIILIGLFTIILGYGLSKGVDTLINKNNYKQLKEENSENIPFINFYEKQARKQRSYMYFAMALGCGLGTSILIYKNQNKTNKEV